MSELPSIQIVLVSPNGKREEGPLIVPDDQSPVQFDEHTWDRERCAEELYRLVRSKDSKDSGGVEAAMRAMNRLDCWRDSLRRLVGLPTPDAELGEGLLSFWVAHGVHISKMLMGDTIFVDALRRFVPPYGGSPITLYRGELQSRHLLGVYGVAWTAKLEVAQMFARRREGSSVVLQIEAGPEMIVSALPVHSQHLGEDEYLVDLRAIGGVKVLETFSENPCA